MYIEWVDLELRNNNLITGTGAFVSSSHNLCFGYMVQPQRNLKGSTQKDLRVQSIHWFTEHILLNARHMLGFEDRGLNKAILIHN